eukprot:8741260-Heterocapsa_arctica.AAC.1
MKLGGQTCKNAPESIMSIITVWRIMSGSMTRTAELIARNRLMAMTKWPSSSSSSGHPPPDVGSTGLEES